MIRISCKVFDFPFYDHNGQTKSETQKNPGAQRRGSGQSGSSAANRPGVGQSSASEDGRQTPRDTVPRAFQFSPFNIPHGGALKHYLIVIACMFEELTDQPFTYGIDEIEHLETSTSIIDFAVASYKVANKYYVASPVTIIHDNHVDLAREIFTRNTQCIGAEWKLLMAILPSDWIADQPGLLEKWLPPVQTTPSVSAGTPSEAARIAILEAKSLQEFKN